MNRHINAAGLAMLKDFEGLRLTVYNDSAGKPTIGYGHLIKPGEDFTAGITEEYAEEMLRQDLHYAETAVSRFIRTGLTDNQFAALVSLVFNTGNAPLLGTLGRKLNQIVEPDYAGAADEFLRWDHAGGEVVPGLTRRRKAERELFLT